MEEPTQSRDNEESESNDFETMSSKSSAPKPEQTTPKPLARRPNFKRLTRLNRPKYILIIVSFILALGFGFLGGWIEQNANQNDTSLGANLSSQEKVVTSESQLIDQIAKNVGPSVVSVNVISEQQTPDSFFGFSSSDSTEQSAGTGIILSSDGLIITNRHVVPVGTTQVSVTLSNGTELKDVKVLGRTSSSDSLDIAFLKVGNTEGQKLVPAQLGDSSKVQVGDAVVAIGNALGQFQNTVTSGIISGHGRSVQASSQGTGADSENLTDLFQTDAAINEGNSGGPLVNMNGQVIGINTALAGNAQNIGFSIPINDVKGLIKQVMATGKLEQSYLGVRFVPLTADYAYEFNLPVNRGAYLAPSQVTGQPAVVSGSPAAKAGLKEKDIITQVNGTDINENTSLTSLLSQHAPGDTVNLTVIRNGKTLHIMVKLGTAPSDNSQ